MTTTKKILATSAAIAFAATLSSCEMKKGEEKNTETTSQIKVETPKKEVEQIQKEIPAETETLDQAENQAEQIQENPKMKLFNEKQEKMGKLFQEFEKNNPKFKEYQDQINAIFSSGKQPTEEDMKKVQELDKKIRDLFTPEMKNLDKELQDMSKEIFESNTPSEPEQAPIESANDIESNVPPIPENQQEATGTGDPIMILK